MSYRVQGTGYETSLQGGIGGREGVLPPARRETPPPCYHWHWHWHKAYKNKMEEVHKYLDRFGWILTSYMEMETEGMVKNGWSRIVVFGAPRGELPVQTD